MNNRENHNRTTHAHAVSDIMTPRVTKSNRILETSFRRVPSVVNFTIKPSQVNSLLVGTGLDRNLPVQTEREIHEGNNVHNQYMEKQLLYLKRCLAVKKYDQY